MRRTIRVMIAMALLVGVFSVVANARTFQCPGPNDPNTPPQCTGTNDRDVISEREGNRVADTIDALDGADIVNADEFRRDVDRLFGRAQNDRLRTDDGDGRDFINCGSGRNDVAIADPGDNVNNRNCEDVRRR